MQIPSSTDCGSDIVKLSVPSGNVWVYGRQGAKLGASCYLLPATGNTAVKRTTSNTTSYAPDRVELIALKGIPLVAPGDDLAQLIAAACESNNIKLRDDDVVVVAQKIVSKAEGRVVQLADVEPSQEAIQRAGETEKDAALMQLILDESNEVVRQHHKVLIVEHRLGFVMANAGLDQSNASEGQAILLPEDPDASAAGLLSALSAHFGSSVSVIISDSIGRAWRNGTVGHAIGIAGMQPLLDLRDTPDMFGRPMQVTEVAIADEIAAAASALMGQGDEAKPVVVVRGFSAMPDPDASIQALIRDKDLDLFR
jgi:coenzyme F420-0:L-glutamate ligase/coenzyme F420-1:gamma-L-glutamate ligase